MPPHPVIFDSRYSWRDVYTAAVLEPDNDRLLEQIRLAEESIGLRLIFLTGCEEDGEDLRAIKAALEVLEVLKHECSPKRQSRKDDLS